ncbi:MAG: glycosyltransferase family 4 protein [Dehalococcoidales bacterium]
MMKICLISNLYSPYVLGGAEVYVQRIAQKLAEKHQVTVITQQPFRGLSSLRANEEIQHEVKTYRFYPLNFYFTYYANKAPKWFTPLWHLLNLWNPHSYYVIKDVLKKEKPDIIHSHITGGFSLSVYSAIKSSGYPHIHTCHGYALLSPWAALMRQGKRISQFNFFDRQFMRITRFFSRTVDVASAPSQFVLDMHLKNNFFPNSRFVKIPIGIELNDNEKIDKDYQSIDILYTGQLIPAKGVHTLIESFRKLSSDNVRLHITGKGYYESELRLMAESDSRIVFHGFVTREQLAGLYQQSNVAVFPSLFYENAPAVILESFRAGTPVIGSNIGGIPEIIEDGYNGVLFNAGDSNELKNILQGLISNPSELKRLSDGASQSIKRYDINEHVKKLTELYEEVRVSPWQ